MISLNGDLWSQVLSLSPHDVFKMFAVFENAVPEQRYFLPRWVLNCFIPFGVCSVEKLDPVLLNSCLESRSKNDLIYCLVERLAYLAKSVITDIIYKFERSVAAANKASNAKDLCCFFFPMGLRQLYTENPFLVQLINFTIDRFLQKTTIFLHRLKQDQCRKCKVVHISFSLWEEHLPDKNVHIITFANGKKLVYKEDALAIESGWTIWCQMLKKKGNIQIFYPHCNFKEGYLWQEYIPHSPTKSIDEVRKYYQNSGELLCILYLMNAKDIHCENLIASGKIPFVIDTETILQSRLFAKHDISVEHTYFLPRKKAEGVQIPDMGALAKASTGGFFFANSKMSLPLLDGKIHNADLFVESICIGFSFVYKKIIEIANSLEPYKCFHDVCIRRIIRPTYIYAHLFERLITASKGKKEEECRGFLKYTLHLPEKIIHTNDSYKKEAIINSEIKMLLRGCIPYFYQYADKSSLFDSDGLVISNYSEETPLETLFFQLSNLSKENLKEQLKKIRESLQEV